MNLRAPAGLFAEKCIECGKSPVKRWWIGKVPFDPGGGPRSKATIEIVAADCGECSEAIRQVYLKQHSRADAVRELPFEELCLMRVMFS